MKSTESPAAPAPKPSASRWQKQAVILLGVVFWIIVGSILTFALRRPRQDLLITNIGSLSVEIRNEAYPWFERTKSLTLHPGMTGIFYFSNGDQFRISRSSVPLPQPGMTPPPGPIPPRSKSLGSTLTANADGTGTIAVKHAFRTAVVRVTDAGKISFEFTDLECAETQHEE